MWCFLILTIKWECLDNDCFSEKASMILPLDYSNSSSENLSLPIHKVNKQGTKTPIVFLGPGFGMTNLPSKYNFIKNAINETTVYFLGYRGIDSNIKLPHKQIKDITLLGNESITKKMINRISTEFQKINLSHFWFSVRADDLYSLIMEESIYNINILAVGEIGSRIAHQFASKYPQKVNRIVLAAPSVPIAHNDTTLRLLAIYRILCRKNLTCKYGNVQWLPEEIPKSAYAVFKVSPETVRYSAEVQLRNPSSISSVLEFLQSVTDGSKLGYMALTNLINTNFGVHNWGDVVLYICSKDHDPSIVFPKNILKICPLINSNNEINITTFSDKIDEKISQPVLLIDGELDLPRPNTVYNYYITHHQIPTLVDQIIVNKTVVKYDLMRPDIIKAITDYFDIGLFNISDIQEGIIIWKNSFSFLSSMKWTFIIGTIISLLFSIYVIKKSNILEKESHLKGQ